MRYFILILLIVTVAWTTPASKSELDYQAFEERLSRLERLLDAISWNIHANDMHFAGKSRMVLIVNGNHWEIVKRETRALHNTLHSD